MEVNYATIFCYDTIKTGRSACLTAVGTSMWPVITKGMKAVIEPLELGSPEKGSLLLIKRPNGLMVHRYWGIIYKEGVSLVLTKGDTNLAFDPPVPVSMIIGQVVQLRNSSGDCRNPNRGWLYIFGRVLCSSYHLARFWARLCRCVLKLRN